MLDVPQTGSALAAFVPLATELCDLKRVYDASAPDSLAVRFFRGAWCALAAGQPVEEVAQTTTAAALAAARLGSIDVRVLGVAGLDQAQAREILCRSFDEVAGPLDPAFAPTRSETS